MSLPAAIQYARKRTVTLTWADDDGTAIDLTGAKLYAIKWDKDNAETNVTGTLSVTGATTGTFTWTYSAADVSVAGAYTVQFMAAYSADGTVEISYRYPWKVHESFNFAFLSASTSPSASVSPSPSASPS